MLQLFCVIAIFLTAQIHTTLMHTKQPMDKGTNNLTNQDTSRKEHSSCVFPPAPQFRGLPV